MPEPLDTATDQAIDADVGVTISAVLGPVPANNDRAVDVVAIMQQWQVDHLSTNPTSVVALVAGPFADLIAHIWPERASASYLAAPDARRHLWHAWLANGCAEHATTADALVALRDKLEGVPGRQLMVEAFGGPVPGLQNTLGRLGAAARTAAIYRALARVLVAGGPCAAYVRHARTLPDDMILALAALPAGAACRPALDLLRRGRLGSDAVGFVTWALARLDALGCISERQTVLQAANPQRAAWDALQAFPFPDPPWPGHEPLWPVRSRAQLRQLAHELENCLRDAARLRQAVFGVLNGERAFFELREPEIALVEFRRLGPAGWFLHAAGRHHNRSLSSAAKRVIREATAGWQAAYANEPTGWDAWLDDGDW